MEAHDDNWRFYLTSSKAKIVTLMLDSRSLFSHPLLMSVVQLV